MGSPVNTIDLGSLKIIKPTPQLKLSQTCLCAYSSRTPIKIINIYSALK